ncbi:NAD(P)/FAD-dependent oxidoreductase [Agromyces marinus]|uniref:NAD(P)/FAD-dependent oxidoreductase n=1 Tax=Agromyces marinus TaxID=1389020 RepID=UPI001F4544AA|nr:NAD(P)/FAD-dependent oxidoreductase [Agromyces marinus]UIP57807.1 Alkyl hydroperoxide reductase subunit F [Agromyces marinus]
MSRPGTMPEGEAAAVWDVIVVGGGSAGLSAALMLGRSRRRVLVVDSGRPRSRAAAHMHGVLGRDHTSPADLLSAGRAELTRYDVATRSGEVADAAVLEADAAAARGLDGIAFEVVLDSGERLVARRVLVATGLVDELPEIPGLSEQWGRGVVLCPYCDGWEVRDRRIAVIASSAENAHQAQLMRQLSEHVTFCTQGVVLPPATRDALDARGIAIEERPVVEVLSGDDDALRGIRFEDGDELAAQAVFVAPRTVANDEVLVGLGARSMRQGGARRVLIDEEGRTSVRGVYAAGNVTGPRSSVPWTMATGSIAGTSINADLVDEDVTLAVSRRRR